MDNLQDDISFIFSHTKSYWEEFKDEEIFITGGTGFFGVWLLKSFIYANEALALNSKMVVLTRNPNNFIENYPEFNSDCIEFYQGDIRDFKYPNRKFKYIIHGATTSAQETYHNEDPLKKYDTVANGTRHLLNFAVECGAKKLLYISSGSVYGKQTLNQESIKEDDISAPNQLDYIGSALPEAKRVAEFFCTYYANKFNIDINIARCFTFVGPYLQMDIHYAIGNFIKSSIEKKEIVINGDGTPQRTFLYSADLMIWLLKIFAMGKTCEAYNVGSNDVVSIKELAGIVSKCFDEEIKITIKNENEKATSSSNKYIPNITKAKEQLGVEVYTDLETAIKKTIQFEKGKFEI
jgi:dTDP-glucose 4,6-dehydratase